MMEKLAGRKAE